MRRAFDQITAAIPFRALVLIRLEYARPEEGKIPGAHQRAVVQRPAQLRGWWRVSDRRERIEIGPDRQRIGLYHFCEMRVGERGVVTRAVRRDAEAERADKVVIAPGAEAGVTIGRQVRRINAAERGVDTLAAGEGF